MALQKIFLACFVSVCHSQVTELYGYRQYLQELDLREKTSRYLGYTQQEYSPLGCVLWCNHRPSCWSVLSCPQLASSNPQKHNCLLLEELAKTSPVITESNLTTCSFYSMKNRCVNGGTVVNDACVCNDGFYGLHCEQFYRDCSDAYNDGMRGLHLLYVKPDGLFVPLMVKCYLEYGGWTEIARQDSDCTVNHNRTWAEYKSEFGDANLCNWRGLDFIHHFTKEGTTILDAVVINEAGIRTHAYYDNFRIRNETDDYLMHYDGYRPFTSKPAEDGFGFGGSTLQAKDQPFVTYDRDRNNCALDTGTGWWFNSGCASVNLHLKLQAQVPQGSAYAQWPVNLSLRPITGYVLQIKRT
ncbi:fibroleukin-like [Gigantopelta aegis]|uniref:fibroleukin-like n=1 Tax=Gigantopelta aegis TaxID=1735272 RepID=UPI001B88C8CF|nr:fibroleukin-like [Gigantopelta aegis]